jgi:hypothetical protein
MRDDGELPVEHETGLGKTRENGDHLRKITCERLARLGLKVDVVTRAQGEAAKAIPFRLVLPIASARRASPPLARDPTARIEPIAFWAASSPRAGAPKRPCSYSVPRRIR